MGLKLLLQLFLENAICWSLHRLHSGHNNASPSYMETILARKHHPIMTLGSKSVSSIPSFKSGPGEDEDV